MVSVKEVKPKLVVEPVFVPFDPWHPVLKAGTPSLHTTDEQEVYIKWVLETCCSDSAFAKKAYTALQFILTQEEPAPPVLSSLSPATAVIGDPSFDLHVLGSGFSSESIIVFNGIDEPTTYVSDTELTTGVNMPIWVDPQTATVAVRNSDGLVSESLSFEFTAPVLLSAPSVKSDPLKK